MGHYEIIIQYNNKDQQSQTKKVKEWDIAIDIGANVGFWTKELCSKFRFYI